MSRRKKPLITPREGDRAGQGVIQIERQQRTGQWSLAETQSVTNAFIVFLGYGQKASKTLLNFFVYIENNLLNIIMTFNSDSSFNIFKVIIY